MELLLAYRVVRVLSPIHQALKHAKRCAMRVSTCRLIFKRLDSVKWQLGSLEMDMQSTVLLMGIFMIKDLHSWTSLIRQKYWKLNSRHVEMIYNEDTKTCTHVWMSRRKNGIISTRSTISSFQILRIWMKCSTKFSKDIRTSRMTTVLCTHLVMQSVVRQSVYS